MTLQRRSNSVEIIVDGKKRKFDGDSPVLLSKKARVEIESDDDDDILPASIMPLPYKRPPTKAKPPQGKGKPPQGKAKPPAKTKQAAAKPAVVSRVGKRVPAAAAARRRKNGPSPKKQGKPTGAQLIADASSNLAKPKSE